MTSVRRWTGREAGALRAALRLSIRSYAEYLGIGVRTITKWQARGATMALRPHMQAILDTALAQASDEAKARFVGILREEGMPAANALPLRLETLPMNASSLVLPDGTQLGLDSRAGRVTDVDRKQFLRASGAAMTLPWMEQLAPTEPALAPAKVGAADVEQVHAVSTALMTLNNTYGGELAREAAFAQLHWAA